MEEKYYTIDQVAELLDMHHKTIRKFISEDKLRATKVGKQWRISGHDLSIFMEKSDSGNEKDNDVEETDIGFSTEVDIKNSSIERINVSSVIDINDLNKNEFARVSNTLLALMNSKDPKMGNSTINMKYYEMEKRLKVLLWGSVSFTEGMLSCVSMLLGPAD